MLFNNKLPGLGNDANLLLKTPFIQHWEGEGINPPPPESELRITNEDDIRITNDGDRRITN